MPPSNYDGDAANVVPPSALTIVASSNANPIVVTISGSLPADFFTGCLVHVQGHQTNVSANGVWRATVTGASSFSIPVAGVGVGGATGTAQPLNLPPSFAVPSDGDPDNAASIAAWSNATGDRTSFLAARGVGLYKLAGALAFQFFDQSSAGGVAWAQISANLTAGTAVQLTAQTATWSVPGASGLSPVAPTATQPALFSLAGFAPGDLVEVDLTTTWVVPGTARMQLLAALANPGLTPSWPADYSPIAASVGSGPGTVPIALHGAIGFTTAKNLFLSPVLIPFTSGVQTHALGGDTTLWVKLYRPTGMPQ